MSVEKVKRQIAAGHGGLRPYRTHKNKKLRCICGWEGSWRPHERVCDDERLAEWDAHTEEAST